MPNFFKHLKNIINLKEGEEYEIEVEIPLENVILFLIIITLLLWKVLK